MLSGEDRAGLYITVIVHLAVIVLLLSLHVGAKVSKDNSFVIDFSREEAIEEKEKEEKAIEEKKNFEEIINQRVNQMIASSSERVKNVTVDRSQALKDDRGTDAQKLYEDAARLEKELKAGYKVDEPDEDYVPVSQPAPVADKSNDAPPKQYSGASVVSWSLSGRSASKLPIPAYRCYGGGTVTVIIGVDNNGNVIYAKVQEETSTNDKCLRDFAIRAARSSRFSASPTAPARQAGDIVYRFVAQ